MIDSIAGSMWQPKDSQTSTNSSVWTLNVDWRLVINSILAAKLCCLCVYFRIGLAVEIEIRFGLNEMELNCEASNKSESEYEYKSTVRLWAALVDMCRIELMINIVTVNKAFN